MPQSFFKRCSECRRGFQAPKKNWKLMRRSKNTKPVCLSHILDARMIVMPYIPLLKPVRI